MLSVVVTAQDNKPPKKIAVDAPDPDARQLNTSKANEATAGKDDKVSGEDSDPPATADADAEAEVPAEWKPKLKVTLNLMPEGGVDVINRSKRDDASDAWTPPRDRKAGRPAKEKEEAPKTGNFQRTSNSKPRPVMHASISGTATLLCDDISLLVAGSEDGQPVYQISIKRPAVLFVDDLRVEFDSLESDNEFAILMTCTVQHSATRLTAEKMKLNLKVYGAATRSFNKPVSEFDAAVPTSPPLRPQPERVFKDAERWTPPNPAPEERIKRSSRLRDPLKLRRSFPDDPEPPGFGV